MPMDFPDIESLKSAARVHKFREFNEGNETEDEYRLQLAKHVRDRDRIESFEIQFGIGWDQWTDKQKKQSLFG